MKVAVWDESGSIEVVDKPLTEPESGWVRLKVASCGVCGSDLHEYRNRSAVPGITPGHEIAGFIDGSNRDIELPTGALVAVEPIDSCGRCGCCVSGHYNRCTELKLMGIAHPGGFAEYVDAPANRLHRLPDDLDIGIAALAEPLAVGVRAVRLARLDFGARVAVLGAGTIGLLAIAAARAGGAASIHATARHPQQAELAKALGADETFPDIDAMHAAVGDRTYDAVLETVGGQAPTISEAVRVAAPGAVIVMIGVFDADTPVPALDFLSKELTLVGSSCYAFDADRSDFGLAAAMLPGMRDRLEPVVTHRFGLDDVLRGFDTAMDKSSGSVKVEIQPA